uniref:DUF3511 domain-containing protein n=1 Tax=Oryza punctata TaxID=4537 RepID=A0A0E0JHM0_ORYPU
MADLHRTYRGDSFHPSSSSSSSSSSSVHRHATVLPLPFPEAIHATAADHNEQQRPPPPRLAMAPKTTTDTSTPPPGAFRRCGWRVRGVSCVGCFGDPESKRRRRVAGYKAYAVEGKVKASLRRGIRWFKRKCSAIFRA